MNVIRGGVCRNPDYYQIFQIDRKIKPAKRAMDMAGWFDEDWEEDYGQYLSRGDEKLLSLLREKKVREKCSTKEQNFFTLFSNAKIEQNKNESLFEYIAKVVHNHMIAPVLKDAVKKYEAGEAVEWESLLSPWFAGKVKIQEPDEEKTRVREYLHSAAPVMEVSDGETQALFVLDPDVKLSKRQKTRFWLPYNSKNAYRVADTMAIAFSLTYKLTLELFYDRYQKLDTEERETDSVVHSAFDQLRQYIQGYVFQSRLVIRRSYLEKFEEIRSFLKKAGFGVYPVKDEISWREVHDKLGVGVMDTNTSYLLQPFLPELMEGGIFLHEGYRISRIGAVYICEKLFLLLYQEYYHDCRKKEYLKELNGSSARVWETKKNIPDKYKNRMVQSDFNRYFRYIEIDGDCDLSSIREIELEFEALKKQCFDDSRYDAELRFRKLGRHKASGLYFPSLRCMCVDIRSPSSFGHEYLHMYDYFHGGLSDLYDFGKVRNAYEKALRRYLSDLPADSAERKQLEGKNKFNLDYYLTRTEIFARCGEMYFTKTCKVDNTLLRPQWGFAYPEDQDLMEEINRYYSRLFPESRYYADIKDKQEES